MDPLINLVISCGFAGLFLSAALKKLLSFSVFKATLEGYQIIPAGLQKPVSSLVIVLEFLLCGMWIIEPLRQTAAIGSSMILAMYAVAIGVNLLRSRSHISCGCGWREQPLSWALVARNGIYILIVLSTLIPQIYRELQWIDFALGVLALTGAVLLNRCAETLIANNSNIASWRQ
jgi:hypothetical protein